VAVGAALTGSISIAPIFLITLPGSLIVGSLLGRLVLGITRRVEHVPTSIILQFVGTLAIWLLAEHLGLSGVLTTVCYAMSLALSAPHQIPARTRIPSYAVWETVLFGLNILAFIFIGLQIRPIFEDLEAADRMRYLGLSGAVLVTVIAVRFAWHMSFNAVVRWRHRRYGFHPPRPMLRPTVGSGLLISWAGMRGIVTLAAALALPAAFPNRGLVVFTAFAVVLGTLIIQGLTLKPLLQRLNLRDDDPVGQEAASAREKALQAALESCRDDQSPMADLVRREFQARLGEDQPDDSQVRQAALNSARDAVLGMRTREEIGDDAFHRVEEDLDWLEMADRT